MPIHSKTFTWLSTNVRQEKVHGVPFIPNLYSKVKCWPVESLLGEHGVSLSTFHTSILHLSYPAKCSNTLVLTLLRFRLHNNAKYAQKGCKNTYLHLHLHFIQILYSFRMIYI